MAVNMLRNLLILYLCLECCCFEHANESVYLPVDTSGVINTFRNLPECGRGRIIKLIAYNFQRRECDNQNICKTVYTKPFTAEQELWIHRRCSFRESCINISNQFDSNEQEQGINTLHIVYRCLDKATGFIDLCIQDSMQFTDKVHLIYQSNASLFRECRCFIRKGSFTIHPADIRLQAAYKEKCSTAKLIINAKQYVCDDKQAAFGSVFMTKNKHVLSIAFISLTKLVYDDEPEMLWITIHPQGAVNLTCERKLWDIVPTTDKQRKDSSHHILKEYTALNEENATQAFEENPITKEMKSTDVVKAATATSEIMKPTERNSFSPPAFKMVSTYIFEAKTATGKIMKPTQSNSYSKPTVGERQRIPYLKVVASISSASVLIAVITGVVILVLRKRKTDEDCQHDQNTDSQQNTTQTHHVQQHITTADVQAHIYCSQQTNVASRCNFRGNDSVFDQTPLQLNADSHTPISSDDDYYEIKEINETIRPAISEYEQLLTEQKPRETDYSRLSSNNSLTDSCKSANVLSLTTPSSELQHELKMEELSLLVSHTCWNNDDYLHPISVQEDSM